MNAPVNAFAAFEGGSSLRPYEGRLHVVGAVLETIPLSAFGLIGGQKTVSGSPVASPGVVATMLDFCVRHGIAPMVEKFPMARVSEAIGHLRAGRARYRLELENDLG